MARWPDLDQEAIRRSNRKQALVPEGATVLEPVGTAPGLVVPPPTDVAGRRSSSCPGRRASCSRCGRAAVETEAFRAAVAGATEYRQHMLRLFGIPESEIAETAAGARGGDRPRRARDHDLPAARRGRGRHALRAAAAGRLRRVRGAGARAPPRDLFSTTGRRSTSRWRRCCGLAAARSPRPSRARAACSPAG